MMQQRTMFLLGPDEDMEEESVNSVTELKEIAAQKAKKKAEDEKNKEKEAIEEKGRIIRFTPTQSLE